MTPSVVKARAVKGSEAPPGTVSGGVLTSSHPAGVGPAEALFVQRVQLPNPTFGVTDTCGAASQCHVARHQLTEGFSEPTFERNQKRKGEQVGVIENPEGAQREHKKGNLETESAEAEKEMLAYEEEIAHECQLENEVGGNGLGFSNHTPIVNKTKCKNSPHILFSAPNDNF